VPYYGLVNTDKAHAVGWLSRDECKSGHVPDGETLLIVQANHEWSVEHYDADPAENVAMLAEHAADIVGDDRLADPAWTDYRGWRYAQPETGVDRGPLDSACQRGCPPSATGSPGRPESTPRSRTASTSASGSQTGSESRSGAEERKRGLSGDNRFDG